MENDENINGKFLFTTLSDQLTVQVEDNRCCSRHSSKKTLKKSLGETKILSFYSVFNSLSTFDL